MLSIERTKSLIGKHHITDEEVETVRDSMRSLVEVIFEKWNEDNKSIEMKMKRKDDNERTRNSE